MLRSLTLPVPYRCRPHWHLQTAIRFLWGAAVKQPPAAWNLELAVLQAQNDRFSRSFAEAERIFRNVVDSLFDSEPSKAFQKWGINKTRNYLFTWLDRQAN